MRLLGNCPVVQLEWMAGFDPADSGSIPDGAAKEGTGNAARSASSAKSEQSPKEGHERKVCRRTT